MPPNVSTAFATAAAICASSRMSTTQASALPPARSISSAAEWIVPGRRGWASVVLAAMTTLAPSFAARSAMARPMPRLAPLMKSVFPERVGMGQPFAGAAPEGKLLQGKKRTFAFYEKRHYLGGMATATARTTAGSKPSVDGILEAAERVFARQGYGETSLRQLIAEAGISTTAFYARFDSKEQVLDALVVDLFARLNAAAVAALGGARGIEDGFDRGIDALIATLGARKDLVRLTLTEAASSPRSLATLRASLAYLAQMLAARLARLVERGDVQVDDVEALAWALVGALKIQVLRWAVYGDLDDRGLARALRSTARTVLPGIMKKRGKR